MVWQKFLKMSGRRNVSSKNKDNVLVGAVALMIQVAAEHDGVSFVEYEAIIKALKELVDGSEERALQVYETAKNLQEQSTDLYCLTRGIMKHTKHEDQIQIVGLLYRIGYADGHLDHDEDHVIARISGLLGVDTRDRILAKKQALQKRLVY